MIRPAKFSKYLVFLALPILFGILAGCGKKGPVRPLAQPTPLPPQEFVLRQQGSNMLLVWTLPQANSDGSPLTDLAGFRIYRAVFEPEDDCPTCLKTPDLWRVVDLDYLRDVQRVGNRFFLTDESLEAGQGYQYRIIPFNRWSQDGEAALARQVIVDPPSPPPAVAVKNVKSGLNVTWDRVENLPEGMELIGYNVYRRRPGGAFPPAPRNEEPLTSASFVDSDFTDGKTYLFAVRTVVRRNDRILESPLSVLATVSAH